ncbi:SPW repeat domain-containing protein [Saccharothrix xinjiangensis]|uniref:SPW repeat protein n=1 Tax=Saccharothrix xinjiangensis TaxID=204798 RepID=A0ABV9XYF3_9PSEU
MVSFGVAMSFLAGLWLLMAPFALGHQGVDGDFDPRWNSVFAGFAVAVCSLVHAMAPRETPWLAPVLPLIGAWLVVTSSVGMSPVGMSPVVGHAAVSDAVTGGVVLVVGLGAVARAVTRWRRAGGRRVRIAGDRDRHTR